MANNPPHAPPAGAPAHEFSSSGRSDYRDDGLVRAMTPVTEGAVRRSVELNPQIMAEALFPIMGPAIRRSIAHALEGMMRTLNAAMENSFSPQSVQWRLEAWRTGKSFAEVVVLRTLVFRVEQVFLIEKNGGTLLQHVAVDPKLAENSELVSAMLTAIQDFVRDSFNTTANEGIGSVTVGDLTLWIETGPEAVVAAVIRGSPPHDLRDALHDTLVVIHREHLKPLTEFSGDMETLAPTRELLEGCLRQQRLPAATDAPTPAKPARRLGRLPIIAALGALGLGIWAGFAWRDAKRWREFRKYVREVPGVVLFRAERRHGNYYLEGLFDPLADDPLSKLATFSIPAEKVRARWTPFQSLEPRIVTRRARQEASKVIESIESTVIVVEPADAPLSPEIQGSLARVAAEIARLHSLSPQAERSWIVQVASAAPEGAGTGAVVAFLRRAGVAAEHLALADSPHAAPGAVKFRVVQSRRE